MHRIILHAFDDEGFEARSEAALAIARQTGAHLTVMHVRPTMTAAGDVYAAGLLSSSIPESIEAEMRADEQRFRTKAEGLFASEDVPWDWQVQSGLPERELSRESVLSDLLVVSPVEGMTGAQSGETFLGRTLNAVACPMLSVPTADVRFSREGRILLLWNGSAEAGRALRGAMPFLQAAEAVRILTIGTAPRGRPTASDAARYLTPAVRNVEVREAVEDGKIGDQIREESNAFSADLVVMGAYGHARLAELVLGGVTQAMLVQHNIPVLFAR